MNIQVDLDSISHEGCKKLVKFLEEKKSWKLRMVQSELLPRQEVYLVYNKIGLNGRIMPLEVCIKPISGMVSITGPREAKINISFTEVLADNPSVAIKMLKEFEGMLPKGSPMKVNK